MFLFSISDQILKIIEFSLKVIGIPIAIWSFIRAVLEFRNAQRWKKAEFLAKEAKEFFADKNVTRALTILDYRENDLPVFNAEIPGITHIHFNQEILLKALSIDKNVEEFSAEDRLIRQIVDEFLTKLSYFNRYIDTKLITLEDLKPYLKYWINILGNPNSGKRSRTVMKQLWAFIDYFEYDEVRSLVNRFGFEPDFKPESPKS